MTNNPTIDGEAGRETLRAALAELLDCPYVLEEATIPRGGVEVAPNQVVGTVHISIGRMRKLRALLDAPVVERQPKPYPDRLCHIDYTAHPYRCGCLKGDEEAQRRFNEHQVAELQSTIAQLEDKLNKAIDLDFQRRETIEQLQARIAALNSDRK